MNTELFAPLDVERRADLERLLDVIDKTFPVPGKHRSELPRDVAMLSRALTSDRADREGGYLGKPAELSAYLRYFLPWNVFRLARLLPNLPISLNDGDAITDLGSGPLTVAIALWIARPDLRGKKLEFRCLDRTGKVLDSGAAIFAALSGEAGSAWKIRTIRGPLGTRIDGPAAALVTAANVFNEVFWDDRHPLAAQAERKAAMLSALAREDGSVLVVEPGIPRSGEFVSALRGALLGCGRPPIAPCTHSGDCPFSGGRRGAKWCHFAFDTDEAPARLHRLSAAAGIPKERATLSFVMAGGTAATARAAPGPTRITGTDPMPAGTAGAVHLRVISDAFALPGGIFGRYACSPLGAALLSGDRPKLDRLHSGALVEAPHPGPSARRDEKSGAIVFPLGARNAEQKAENRREIQTIKPRMHKKRN